jgi:hypothetical protein
MTGILIAKFHPKEVILRDFQVSYNFKVEILNKKQRSNKYELSILVSRNIYFRYGADGAVLLVHKRMRKNLNIKEIIS